MREFIDKLVARYPILMGNQKELLQAYAVLEECYSENGKLLIAGNGGSASDAEHIVGELMKSFCLQRNLDAVLTDKLARVDSQIGKELSEKLQGALPAISLASHIGFSTAFLNDVDGRMCFAQQIIGYGNKEDVFLGISTSGNSQDVIYAAVAARAKGLKVIGLTGYGGGKLAEFSDVLIAVEERETYKVQELHLPIYHCLCRMLEKRFWGL